MDYILGIDVGTSNVKAVLFDKTVRNPGGKPRESYD